MDRIFGRQWNEPVIIHGSAFLRPEIRKKYLGRQSGRRTTNRTAGSKSPQTVKCLVSCDNTRKIAWLAEEARIAERIGPFLFIADNDGQLLSAGVRFTRETGKDRVFIYTAGTFRITSKGLDGVDTMFRLPDSGTEPYTVDPVPLSTVSLMDIRSFLNLFFGKNQGANAFRGKIINHTVILSDIDFECRQTASLLPEILRFTVDNHMTILITAGAEQTRLMQHVQRLGGSKAVVTDGQGTQSFPSVHIRRIDTDGHEYMNAGDPFLRAVAKHYRQDARQVILCPDTWSAQHTFFLLETMFREKNYSIRKIFLHHGMYGLKDMHNNMKRLTAQTGKSPVILVSTPESIPDIYGIFDVMYLDSIPLRKGAAAIYRMFEKSRLKHHDAKPFVYLTGLHAANDKQYMQTYPGELSGQNILKIVREPSSSTGSSIVTGPGETGNIRMVPEEDIVESCEVNLHNRLLIPYDGAVQKNSLLKKADVIPNPSCSNEMNLMIRKTPYMPHLGLIDYPGSPEKHIY